MLRRQVLRREPTLSGARRRIVRVGSRQVLDWGRIESPRVLRSRLAGGLSGRFRSTPHRLRFGYTPGGHTESPRSPFPTAASAIHSAKKTIMI